MGTGIENIFAEALSVPAGDLTRFLRERCAGDESLIANIRSLVESYRSSDSFMEQPVAEVNAQELPPEADADEWIGTQVGEFKLVRLLGAGGCGRVYLADQVGDVRRQVALKIVRPGLRMRDMLARFNVERQALVTLEHPNIAKLFAAGQTAQGLPYFAMEYIPGVPLTTHCERNKLSTDQRLNIFVQVCRAVQHMHGRGIIHRDLKPSNVLVNEADGQPKVIDFGIAKSSDGPLVSQTFMSKDGSPIGTLEYMSPEQLHGRSAEVDNRTDVYALGVILYELLTGSRPFEVSQLSFPIAIKWILDHEPLKASTRVLRLANAGTAAVSYKELKGDLDWILLKAIARDKDRRYSTVQELEADVQRFRQQRPILARPDSAAYRVRKFIARNRAVSTLGAALVLALCAATIVGFVAAGIARSAEAGAIAAALRNAQLAYRSSITSAAANALRDPAIAKRAIAEAPSELRDWEWHFLQATIEQTPEFHSDGRPMSALAASRDGRWLAIGMHHGQILVWARGVPTPRELISHDKRIQCLRFGPNGSTMVSGSSDGRVFLWNVETGGSTLLGRHDKGVNAVAIDGTRIAAGDAGGTIRLWTVDGRALGEIPGTEGVSALAFAGELIVGGHAEGNVRVVDMATLRVVREWPGGGRGIRTLVVADDNSEVITGNLAGVAARWNMATGELLHRFTESGHPGFRSFDLSADERLIAAGDQYGDITVWDRVSGERVGHLTGRNGSIEGIAFVGSSTEVASASWNGVARGWTIGFGHAQRHFPSTVGRPLRAWFEAGSPGIRGMTSRGRVGRWNTDTGELADAWDLGGATAIAVDPQGQVASFAAEKQVVQIIDLARRTRIGTVPASAAPISTALIGERNLVAFGCESGLMEVWDWSSGERLHSLSLSAGCTSLAASPDGSFFAAGFRNGSARIVDLRTGSIRALSKDWSSPVQAIAFSPDSRTIAFGLHENSVATLHLVDAESAVVVRSSGGGGAGIESLTFSPSGRRIASSGGRRSLRIWGVDDGQELLVLRGLDGEVSALAFSADGLTLAACTSVGSLYIYSGSMPEWWWLQPSSRP